MAESVRPRILIAHSYRGQVVVLENYLQELSRQIEIVPVKDGRAALSAIERQKIHLFLVDGFLKGAFNGFDLCRALRSKKEHRRTPIVLMLSGHLIPEHARGISAGADLLLHTPVVKEELWRMVILLLESASLRQRRESRRTVEESIELPTSIELLH